MLEVPVPVPVPVPFIPVVEFIVDVLAFMVEVFMLERALTFTFVFESLPHAIMAILSPIAAVAINSLLICLFLLLFRYRPHPVPEESKS
jgi:hypothetical protein